MMMVGDIVSLTQGLWICGKGGNMQVFPNDWVFPKVKINGAVMIWEHGFKMGPNTGIEIVAAMPFIKYFWHSRKV